MFIVITTPSLDKNTNSPTPFPGRDAVGLFLFDNDPKITNLRALHDGLGADQFHA